MDSVANTCDSDDVFLAIVVSQVKSNWGKIAFFLFERDDGIRIFLMRICEKKSSQWYIELNINFMRFLEAHFEAQMKLKENVAKKSFGTGISRLFFVLNSVTRE